MISATETKWHILNEFCWQGMIEFETVKRNEGLQRCTRETNQGCKLGRNLTS